MINIPKRWNVDRIDKESQLYKLARLLREEKGITWDTALNNTVGDIKLKNDNKYMEKVRQEVIDKKIVQPCVLCFIQCTDEMCERCNIEFERYMMEMQLLSV